MTSSQHRSDELKELEEEPCRLEMTPMIDVTFLLLIFFMCTLKFKTLDGALGAYLPKDMGVQVAPGEPLEKVVVQVDVVNEGSKVRRVRGGGVVPYSTADAEADLRFDYGADRLVRYRVGPHSDLDFGEAIRMVSELQMGNPEARYSIDARDGVVQQDVVQVMDAMLGLGITEVTFMGSRTER
jgi:biopolymer transport protein ExbD